MGFLDKLGETFSNTSKEVAKKTKDFTDIAKLNSKVTTEEDCIQKAYLKIGQLFYEANKDSLEIDGIYAEYFGIIKASQENITELKREINKIKGVTLCKECGAEVANGSAFCPKCGTKVEKEIIQEPAACEEPEIVLCKECGAELEEGAVFCTKCGTSVNKTAEAETEEEKKETEKTEKTEETEE